MMLGGVSTGNIDQAWVEPRNVTPHRELEKLVVNTSKPTVSNRGPTENERDEGSAEITASAPPSAPIRHSPPPASSNSFGEMPEIKPVSSMLSLPIEKNVWDDDDYGSGRNITMSFE